MTRRNPERETLVDRIALLLRYSGGTMPIAMVVSTEAEAEAARALLQRTRNKAARLINVIITEDIETWKTRIIATVSTDVAAIRTPGASSASKRTAAKPRSRR